MEARIAGWFDSVASIVKEFRIEGDDRARLLDGRDRVLVASYGGGYEGGAFVLFERDGALFEAYGSHCSCYGLEGQWDPERSNETELRLRAERSAATNGWRTAPRGLPYVGGAMEERDLAAAIIEVLAARLKP